MSVPKTTTTCPEWLYADDLMKDGRWQQFALRIKAVHPPDTFDDPRQRGKKIPGEALEFKGAKKLMTLNKGNRRILGLIAGSQMREDWIGLQVTLYVVSGKFFGIANCPAIRIRPPENATIPFAIQKAMKEERDLTGTSAGVAPRAEVEAAASAERSDS